MWGGWRTRRWQVGVEEAAVLLDRSAQAGGLVLTRMELPIGAWELELNDRVRKAPLPEVRRARSLGFSALALLFLAAALLMPLPKQIARPVNAAAATKMAQVEARAEALAKEVPLEEGVEAELARLREELSEGRFDAADWEAADHLDAQLTQKAAQAAADLARAADAAQALEDAMAKAQANESVDREREALERALMELDTGAQSGTQALDNALASLGRSDQGGSDGSGEQGESGATGAQGQSGAQGQNGSQSQSGVHGQNGSQGQNESQSQSGSQGQNGSQGQTGSQGKSGAQKQSEQGGPSKSQISKLKKALQQRREQLAKSWGQNGSSMNAQNGSGQGGAGQQGSRSGNGNGSASQGSEPCGPGGCRGGGAGNLTFDNLNEVDPDRLAFAPLPEGHGGDEPGELWGLRAVDPKPSTEPSIGGGASGTTAAGDQAPGNDQGALLPRNRDLIKRYFDSPNPTP
ncbi:MAG: hypothetical protein IRZ16_02975 [Myxococcaceae bacterium]|nr:hypothetical protein [Myxococcaceae bacterium]